MEATAAEAVVTLFEDEGLLVLDIDTAIEAAEPRRATAVVVVLYGTGRGHPTEGTYRVELESLGATWTVVSVEDAS